MAYATTADERSVALELIGDRLQCEVLAELFERLRLDVPDDDLSDTAKAAMREIRLTFEPPAPPRFERGSFVRIKGVPKSARRVVDLPHLRDGRWLYAIRTEEEQPLQGEVFEEDELEPAPAFARYD